MSRLIVKNLPNGVSAEPGPGNLKLGPVGSLGLGGKGLGRIEGFSLWGRTPGGFGTPKGQDPRLLPI